MEYFEENKDIIEYKKIELNKIKDYKNYIVNNLFFDIKNNYLIFLIKDNEEFIDTKIIEKITFEGKKIIIFFKFNSVIIKLNNDVVNSFNNFISKHLFVILDKNNKVLFIKEVL